MPTLFLIAVASLAGAAQNGERWSDSCNDLRGQRFGPDERVAGCTTLIESDMLSARNLVYALHNRGLAYRELRDLRRAIADFRRALRLDPDDAPVRAALCETLAAAGQTGDPACPAS